MLLVGVNPAREKKVAGARPQEKLATSVKAPWRFSTYLPNFPIIHMDTIVNAVGSEQRTCIYEYGLLNSDILHLPNQRGDVLAWGDALFDLTAHIENKRGWMINACWVAGEHIPYYACSAPSIGGPQPWIIFPFGQCDVPGYVFPTSLARTVKHHHVLRHRPVFINGEAWRGSIFA